MTVSEVHALRCPPPPVRCLIFSPLPLRMPPPITNRYAYKHSRDQISLEAQEATVEVFRSARPRAEAAISEPVVEMVQGARPRPALAENLRSLPHSGLGGDASADAGGSRHPQVP
ncbi:hypothetical protein NSPZN2_100027 [Nitrospira defluvii]|uniref:Uncharacterized protein n=1 Tax=Nitrospira defluvii TaxID=330214 RepID=A0ABM8QZ84_9BACT|nr:hypothetical protein NSPZN2_100027 [Nitrospira defluvii]